MNNFKIVPLSPAYAARIRETKKDDFGHTVIEQVATGYVPCRVSLRPFVPGEDRRLLFSHSPFTKASTISFFSVPQRVAEVLL